MTESYAIHDGSVITNVIRASSQELAEELTGQAAMAVVNDEPQIGWVFLSGAFRAPRPYPSWSWDEQAEEWVAPNPNPGPVDELHPVWNEESQEWEYVTDPGIADPVAE